VLMNQLARFGSRFTLSERSTFQLVFSMTWAIDEEIVSFTELATLSPFADSTLKGHLRNLYNSNTGLVDRGNGSYRILIPAEFALQLLESRKAQPQTEDVKASQIVEKLFEMATQEFDEANKQTSTFEKSRINARGMAYDWAAQVVSNIFRYQKTQIENDLSLDSEMVMS